jgi:glutaredoxin
MLNIRVAANAHRHLFRKHEFRDKIMAIIRLLLGKLILLLNWVFTPRSIRRSPSEQAIVDAKTAELKLYQYQACPFCVKVRRAIKRKALNIDTSDVKRSADAREELMAGGGSLKVPCLRIEDGKGQTQWMYESNDIIHYLSERFPSPARP